MITEVPRAARRPFSALALLMICTGCRAPAPPPVLTAEVIVVPASGGMAQFTVNRDGTISGGHLSGDARPFVHEDNGRLEKVVIDSLWALVQRLEDSLPAEVAPTGKGYVTLQLAYQGARAWDYSWPSQEKARDARVQAVADWLFAHKIGGW